MKKIKNIILMLTLITLGVIIQYSCSTTKETLVLNDQNLFSFSALSSANILSDNSVSLNNKLDKNNFMKLSNTKENIDMDQVNEYLQMMENLLVDGGPALLEKTVSDKEGYQVKLIFEAKDLSGNKTRYTMYFNETILKYKDDDIFDLEEEFSLNGLAVIDGVEYKMIGQREVEGKEEELELKISLDQYNYVLIDLETETDEREYNYKVVKEGRTILNMSFEIENSKEIEIFIRSTENGQKVEYKFYKDLRNEEIVIIHKVNGAESKIVVLSYKDRNNETIYEYKIFDKTYKYSK